jgi:NADH-quinone oxidoreductase subunit D
MTTTEFVHDEAMRATHFDLSMGPSHPSTHGVLRLQLELDGETVQKCEPVVGYLHRGMEKIAENCTTTQFIPYTDRLDYLSCLSNNIAFALAVEKLAGVQVPPRCAAIRVVACELARISSHLLGLGSYAMDAGAWTVFMYGFAAREKIYDLTVELTGARMTTNFARIGGVARDLPEGWSAHALKVCAEVERTVGEIDAMLTRNKIFYDRSVGVGVISATDAVAWGLTGPNLRASGVPLDLRKDKPYSGYEQYDFDVVVGKTGDAYERYLVRMEEVRQSLRIVRQALEKMPAGPVKAEEARKVVAPNKKATLTSMESLIQNFIITTQGPQLPVGEVYAEAENPRGSLGFYIVSHGGGVPYRLKIRSPSFCTISAMSHIIPGHMFADIPVILGSLDFIMGECDR